MRLKMSSAKMAAILSSGDELNTESLYEVKVFLIPDTSIVL